jgi:ribosome-associated protein
MTAPAPAKGGNHELRVFAIEVARLLADRHCEDVRLLDVRGLSQVCDYVLIGTGTSDRQMKAVADEVVDFGRDHDQPMFRTDADAAVTWIVLDFVGLVAHLFEPGRRAYYDLEGLWCDAEPVPWQRAGAGAAANPTEELS